MSCVIEIVTGTNEEQIIRVLLEKYPITVEELIKSLPFSAEVVDREIDKLIVKGIVRLELLPGARYVCLLRRDFRFIGKKAQRRFVKHKTGRRPKGPEKYDGPMFG